MYKDWVRDYCLSLDITIGKYTKIFIVRVRDFPAISAYDPEWDKVLIKINETIEAYFDAFPSELEKLTEYKEIVD